MISQQDKFVHFIDYENVHKHVPMDQIARGKHQEVILFVGNQQTIPNEWLRVDYNVTTIRVKRTAKDNLDFHIAMYLGIAQRNTTPDVQFIIWSGDSGFDDLIEHLKGIAGRRIERKDPRPTTKKAPAKNAPAKKAPPKKAPPKKVPAKKVPAKKVPAKKVPAKKASPPQLDLSPSIKVVGERVMEILGETPSQVRPRKKGTLENQIESWRNGIGFTHIPWDIVHWLIQKKHIVVDENERVKYNF